MRGSTARGGTPRTGGGGGKAGEQDGGRAPERIEDREPGWFSADLHELLNGHVGVARIGWERALECESGGDEAEHEHHASEDEYGGARAGDGGAEPTAKESGEDGDGGRGDGEEEIALKAARLKQAIWPHTDPQRHECGDDDDGHEDVGGNDGEDGAEHGSPSEM